MSILNSGSSWHWKLCKKYIFNTYSKYKTAVVTPAPWGLQEKDHDFEISLGYIVSTCQKKGEGGDHLCNFRKFSNMELIGHIQLNLSLEVPRSSFNLISFLIYYILYSTENKPSLKHMNFFLWLLFYWVLYISYNS